MRTRSIQESPMHTACRRGDLQALQFQIASSQADPHAQDYLGRTPIVLAALKKQWHIVSYLANYFLVNERSLDHYVSALVLAASKEQISTFDTLINAGIPVHIPITPLYYVIHIAISCRHIEFLKQLVFSVGPNQQTAQGAPPIMHCLEDLGTMGQEMLLVLLEAEGIDLNVSANGMTPLLLAINLKNEFAVEQFLLTDYQIEPGAQTPDGESLITLAAKKLSAPMFSKLLSHDDIDVNERNFAGESALAITARAGDYQKTKALVCHRNINIPNQLSIPEKHQTIRLFFRCYHFALQCAENNIPGKADLSFLAMLTPKMLPLVFNALRQSSLTTQQIEDAQFVLSTIIDILLKSKSRLTLRHYDFSNKGFAQLEQIYLIVEQLGGKQCYHRLGLIRHTAYRGLRRHIQNKAKHQKIDLLTQATKHTLFKKPRWYFRPTTDIKIHHLIKKYSQLSR